VQNGFGNFAGLIGPALTGFVPDKTSSFLAPFAIAVAMLILGLISWVPLSGASRKLTGLRAATLSTLRFHGA
jgi:phosphotransferase system  glucose/maltose/N-acetylglucosamine-specific IIC component